MAAKHSLRIDFDDATGVVSAVHRCSVTHAGQTISHARDVQLAPGAVAALKGVVDTNREVVEDEAGLLALRHAAAVFGRTQPGVKALAVGGSLTGIGGTDPAQGLNRPHEPTKG